MLIATSVLVVPALCASARASPLLSGYGGPGQGSQAILGSTLINGPPSGGGSRGGGRGAGGGGSQAAPAATSPQTLPGGVRPVATPAGGPRSSVPAPRASVHAPRGAARTGAHRRPGSAPAPSREGRVLVGAAALSSGVYPASERAVAGGGALGLSSGELLGALLVILGLALTVVATRHLGAQAQGTDTSSRRLGAEG